MHIAHLVALLELLYFLCTTVFRCAALAPPPDWGNGDT
jgi:hypothetical protein